MIKQPPLLSFEYATADGEIRPLIFSNPIRYIVASSIEEILPCFELIEKALDEGYYVAGYISYESAPAFNPLYKVNSSAVMPMLWFGVFSKPTEEVLSTNGSYNLSEWIPSITVEDYKKDISSIKQHIDEEYIDQTNYTIRLHSNFVGNAPSLFDMLKSAQQSNYCAYLDIGEHLIISASPELFFHLKDNEIVTRPMKGTMPRGKTITEDEQQRKELYYSEKNRTENRMVVDLLKSELSMIANPGTVQVEKLFDIETYPTVYQMTSTIKAEVKSQTTLIDIFKALFPCGSITGAPKASAMDVIQQLEATPREVYCGTIGYITPEREAIFNVPIRTVIIDKKTGKATYGVGGGITSHSTSEDEFNEVLAKASLLKRKRPTFHLLESFLLQEGTYFLLEEHLCRLQESAVYFQFSIDLDVIRQELLQYAREYKKGDYKVRFLLDRSGEFTIEAEKIKQPTNRLKVTLANKPIEQDNVFLYHKTTNREVYTKFQSKHPDVYDVLLWNEDEELTEFTNGNVVLEFDGELWTPPVNSGLLAGTFRESLLREGKIKERVLTIGDLKKCTNIWFINSVRKWLQVELI